MLGSIFALVALLLKRGKLALQLFAQPREFRRHQSIPVAHLSEAI
jgi:hypothetical protein